MKRDNTPTAVVKRPVAPEAYLLEGFTKDKPFKGVIFQCGKDKLPVLAVANGVVSRLDPTPNGFEVQLYLELPYRTLIASYYDLPRALVYQGQRVKEGDLLGYSPRSLRFTLHDAIDNKAVKPEFFNEPPIFGLPDDPPPPPPPMLPPPSNGFWV